MDSALLVSNIDMLTQEWHARIYMPFFHKYQYLITDYNKACLCNPNLLDYLITSNNLKLCWSHIGCNGGLTSKVIEQVPLSVWSKS